MANDKTGKQDPAEIRREIEETRTSMERNVHALQARLNPERLKNEATTKIRENTVGRVENFAENATEIVKGTGADVFDTIKQNPLPAALAALGLGWLVMESRNTSRQRPERRLNQPSRSYYGDRNPESYRYYEGSNYGFEEENRYGPYGRNQSRYQADYPERRGYGERDPMNRMREGAGQVAGQARDTVRHAASSVGDTASSMASSVGDTASSMASSVGDTASSMASSVGDAASSMASSVSDTASQVMSTVGDTASDMATQTRQQVGEFADAAQRSASRARTRFEEILDENPLLIGAAALALGAAIGMSLPHTPKEDEMFGEVRDNLMEKAQDQAKDTIDKVQQVAEKATTAAKDAAKDEAQNQKLTTP